MKRTRPAPNSKEAIKSRRMIEAAKVATAKFKNPLFGEMFTYAMEQKLDHGNGFFLEFMGALEQPPVGIEEFLDSPQFMGATDLQLWPEVRRTIIEINLDWWKGQGIANHEAVLMGATGTGKSEISKVTTAYHLHILACLKSPQALYGLPQATSIVFVIQAAKPHVTKKIVYMPLRNYVETMPWFQRHLRPHKLIESEMYFEHKNIRVVPGGSDADAILGEAIIGGVIDEINFMNIVQKSKKADVGTGRAGIFDQAQSIYDALSRRKKSRFIYRGPQIGVICQSSSTRYKGDFTDKRKQHVLDHGEKGVYIYEKAQYEVWPQERYCGDKFRVMVANEAAMDIKILDDEQSVPEGATVFEVPIEYKPDFLKDPSGSLRDIIGRSVNSINPFFRRRFKITECVERGKAKGLQSIVYKDNVVLGIEGLPRIQRGHYCQNPSQPRYVHIDLSATGDRCGVAMVRYDGMVEMERRVGGEIITEVLPKATVELAVTIQPDHAEGGEIDIAEVRTWVRQLRRQYGYPVKAVSYDGWASLESRQQWKKQGMPTGMISVDRTSAPYKVLRDAINDDRIDMYMQDVLIQELYDLEFDEQKDKVDHPPNSSKDCADAVCGAYFTMVTRATSWQEIQPDGRDLDPLANRVELDERYDDERPM